MLIRFAAAFSLSAAGLMAGSLLVNPVSGKALRWPSANITMKISRTVHNASGDLGVDRRDSAAVIHAAVADAIAAWNKSNNINVKLELSDDTQVVPGQTLITFTDPAPYDQGICSKERFIACAIHWIGGDGVPVGVTISFNPYKKHSASGFPSTFDVGLLTLHEIGHALGLGHSTVLDAVMSAAPEQEPSDPNSPQFALRQISRDDALTLAANYTEVPLDAGRIEGTVRQQGSPFPGAEVVAVDQAGRVIFSSLTGPDGTYSLAVPGGGDYNVIVGAPFAPMFWTAGGGSLKDREAVSVGSSSVKGGVDFAMTSGPMFGVMNIGILVGDLFYYGYPSLPLARGRETTIGFQRESATPPATMEVPPAVGEFTEDARGEVFSGGVNLVLRKLRVPAAAEPAAYYFLVKTDDASTLLNGGIKVTLNPATESVLDEGGSAVTSVRAGQRIAITGIDLGADSIAAQPWQSGAPYPTQVGGISVRMGDRFAQIVSVSPTRIVAIVPAGLASKVDLAVVSAPGVESKAISLDVQ